MHRASDGAVLNAVLRCGTFADRVIVHEACAVKMPDELPAEQACLIACGFSTGAGAALWATPVQEGSSVAVIGCGGVGLAVIQGARLAGAARIVAVDVLPEKLALAAELGATDTVDGSTGDAVAQVRELTDGVDYAFSAITSPPGSSTRCGCAPTRGPRRSSACRRPGARSTSTSSSTCSTRRSRLRSRTAATRFRRRTFRFSPRRRSTAGSTSTAS